MRLLDRLGVTPLDAVLAGVLVAIGLAQSIAFPIADGITGPLFVLGSTLPLAWRRTRPLEAALVASAFWLIPLDGFPVLGFVVVILQMFAVGDRGRNTVVVAVVTGWAAAASVIGTILGPEEPIAAIGGVLVVVAPVLAGRLVRHLRHQNAALSELTDQLRVERLRAEEAAIGAERARIAQELHDVVGHEVTLIAIQAEAARSALQVSPERAAEPLEAIRATAHRTMKEMRSVLDVLSGADVARSGEDLRSTAERARAAGIPSTLSESGTSPPASSPAVQAVHRIVRECLTNAGRHAPGEPVTIVVEWSTDAVDVTVDNRTDSASFSPGRGLTGMRHRAELLGGRFSAEVVDACFRVRVHIPTENRS